MKLAVLSGKGGTGKTTFATNIAKVLGYRYVDCDVEEPNGYIFLKPKITERRNVEAIFPSVDNNLCKQCKKCVDICEFNALGFAGNKVVVFQNLCHGCGACMIGCPANAITEASRVIGEVNIGKSEDLDFMMGIMNVGEPMAGPIIDTLKKMIDETPTIIDCSPGSSCNVVKSIYEADYAILVTEPTEFGLHDLEIAVKLVKKLGIPHGVILNRSDEYDNLIINYCNENNITLLGRIPFDEEIARNYSRGELLINEESYMVIFGEIAQRIKEVTSCN